MMIAVLALLATLQAGPGVPEYELIPERRYGSVDGSLVFSRVSDLAVAGGILFVSQPLTAEVAIINIADGKLLRTTRQGAGPGEFMRPGGAGTKGDTVWIQDDSLGRISLFNRQGEFVKTIPFPARHAAIGLTIEGDIFGHLNPQDVTSIPLVRFRRSGQALDTLFHMRLRHPLVMVARASNGPYITFVNPFAQAPIAQLDADGRGAVVVTVEGPPGREIEIIRVLDGRRTTLQVSYPSQRIQTEDVERFTQGFPPPLRTRDAIQRMNFPSSWVPVNRLEVAGNGDVWLGSDIRGKSVSWTIVNRAGQIVGRLQSPAGGRLNIVDGDVIWGSEIGPYDVPLVVRYKLERK